MGGLFVAAKRGADPDDSLPAHLRCERILALRDVLFHAPLILWLRKPLDTALIVWLLIG